MPFKINGTTIIDDSNNIVNIGIVSASSINANSYIQNGSPLISGIGISYNSQFVGNGVSIIDFKGSGISTITSSSGISTITFTNTNTSISTDPSQFITTAAGIHTLSNVGIGTTNPTSKLTVSGDVKVIGIITATTFSGSGSSLTNIPSSQLTGSLPAINGSALIGVIGSGSGVIINDDGIVRGTAGTINFGPNLDATFASGIATITVNDAVFDITSSLFI
jgi:hypothetical protein